MIWITLFLELFRGTSGELFYSINPEKFTNYEAQLLHIISFFFYPCLKWKWWRGTQNIQAMNESIS